MVGDKNMENNKSKQVELRKENKAKENKVEEKPKYIAEIIGERVTFLSSAHKPKTVEKKED